MVVVIDCWNLEVMDCRIRRKLNAKVVENALIRRPSRNTPVSRNLTLRRGNGLVFTPKHYPNLVRRLVLRPDYITPCSPEQIGVIEWFMRTLKEERIWLKVFSSFAEAKPIIEPWIQQYNTGRPHQEVEYAGPVEYRYEPAA